MGVKPVRLLLPSRCDGSEPRRTTRYRVYCGFVFSSRVADDDQQGNVVKQCDVQRGASKKKKEKKKRNTQVHTNANGVRGGVVNQPDTETRDESVSFIYGRPKRICRPFRVHVEFGDPFPHVRVCVCTRIIFLFPFSHTPFPGVQQ